MSKFKKNTITKGAMICLALSASAATTANATVTRQAGTDRYATSDKILNLWPKGSTTAILAAGLNHDVDALTVAPLAKQMKAPIILINTSNSTAAIVSKFLSYDTVYIANGTGVISEAIKVALEAEGIKVIRLGGANRYATAYNIAKELGSADTIVVANGQDSHLSDSLSIASIAAAKGMPIFLTDGITLDPASKAYITQVQASKAYVLGGPALVKDALLDSLPNAERLFGADRYATNISVISKFKYDSAIKTDKIYFAGGENQNLIDALTSGPLAGLTGSPIVFASPKGLTNDAITYLNSVVTGSTDMQIMGGSGAVANSVSDKLEEIQASKVIVNPNPSINSINTITNIIDVVNGTTADKLGLPTTVSVTLNDGTIDKVNVTWDTSKYIVTQVGDQIINGVLSVPSGKSWVLKDAQKAVSIKVTVKVGVLAVTSVSAVNLSSLVITFSKPMNDTTVTTTTTKIYLGTSTLAETYTKQWNADKTQLIIAYPSTQSQDTNVRLTMLGVKSATGETLDNYDNTIKINDVTSPVANSITINRQNAFDIIFSEPISLTQTGIVNGTIFAERSQITIDGVNAIATIATDAFGKVSVSLLSNMVAGNHTVVVKDFRDASGFRIVNKQFVVTVDNDVVAPTIVSSRVISRDLVEIVFSEGLNDINGLGTIKIGARADGTSDGTNVVAQAISGYTKETNILVDATKLDINKYLVSADGKTYTFRLGANEINTLGLVDGVGIYYNFLKDVAGNIQTASGYRISTTDNESIKPIAIASVNSVATTTLNKNDIVIDFNEPISVLPTTLEIRDTSNNLICIATPIFAAASATQGYKTRVIVTAGNTGFNSTIGGSYKVIIRGAKDNSLRQNVLEDTTLNITVNGTKGTSISLYTAVLTKNESVASITAPDKITITFPQPMDYESIINPSNYKISMNNGLSYNALIAEPAYLSLVAGPYNKSVVVNFKTDINNTATQNKFKFLTLKDATGSFNTDNETTVTTTDLPALFNNNDISKVELIAKDQIKVTLSTAAISAGKTFANVNASEFGIAFDKAVSWNQAPDTIYAYGTSAILNTAKTEVTITLSKPLDADGKVYNPAGADNNGAYQTSSTGQRHTMGLVVTRGNRIGTATDITSDAFGNKLTITANNKIALIDKVAPTLQYVRQVDTTNNADKFDLVYDEPLTNDAGTLVYDISVKNASNGATMAVTDVTIAQQTIAGTTGLFNNAYRVTVKKNSVANNDFAVSVINPRSIKDASTDKNSATMLTETTVMKSDASAPAKIYEKVSPFVSTLLLGNVNGGTGAKLEAGDTITIGFSEAIDGSSVAMGLTPGGQSVAVSAGNFNAGSVFINDRASGATDYVSVQKIFNGTGIAIVDNKAAVVGNNLYLPTTLTLSADAKTITVTITSLNGVDASGATVTYATPGIGSATLGSIVDATTTVRDIAGNTQSVNTSEPTPIGGF